MSGGAQGRNVDAGGGGASAATFLRAGSSHKLFTRSEWPKVYRLDGRRWLARGWPALVAMTAPVLIGWASPHLPDMRWTLWAQYAAVALAALGMIWLLRLALWRTILEEQAIRVRGLFGERRLAVSAIKGVRRGREFEPALLLEPVRRRAPPMAVTALEGEPGFARWLSMGVVDLDLRAHQIKLKAALADPLLGEVADERQHDIARQGRAGRWLLLLGLSTTLWAGAWPHPYRPAVLAAGAVVPLLVLGWMVWRLQGRRWQLSGEGSWGLIAAAVGPAAALAWRATVDQELIWPWTPLPWAIAAGVAAGLVGLFNMLPQRLRRRRQGRGWRLAPIAGVTAASALAAGAWTWGVLIFDNAWAPGRGQAEFVTLTVTDVSEPDAPGPHRIAFAPWQALETPSDARRLGLASRPAQEGVAVGPLTWQAARAGEAVCAAVYPGARGWPSVVYGVCPPKKPWLR